MLKVGLTGGIACGKTVVRKLLAGRGAFTVDADTVAHELMGPGTQLALRIGEEFSPQVLAKDGSVDRAKLGAVVFADSEARRRLNHRVHPLVIAEERARLAEAERRGVSIAVVDAALMIETGTYRDYDCLLVVTCPGHLQIERLMSRDGLSETEAVKRVEAQIPAVQKERFADYLIDTSGSIGETERRVDEIWLELLKKQMES